MADENDISQDLKKRIEPTFDLSDTIEESLAEAHKIINDDEAITITIEFDDGPTVKLDIHTLRGYTTDY